MKIEKERKNSKKLLIFVFTFIFVTLYTLFTTIAYINVQGEKYLTG